MSETRFWKCDGCDMRTDEMPTIGTFIDYGTGKTPLMEVHFQNTVSGSTRMPEHICQSCYEMGVVVTSNRKDD